MDNNDILFIVKERCEGKEIIFTKQKLEQKKADHPELLKKSFIKCIERALKDPDQVWENYKNKKKRCYYKKYDHNKYKRKKENIGIYIAPV